MKRTDRTLLVRFDALGDSLVTLPLAEAVRESLGPDVFVAASPRGAAAFSGCPFVSGVLEADPGDSVAMSGLLERVREMNFERAFVLCEKMYAYELPFRAGVPERIGFDPGIMKPFKSLLCRRLLTKRAFCETSRKSGSIHEVERQFLLLKAAGISACPKGYSIPLRRGDLEEAGRILPGGVRIALHLSNKWLERGWTVEFLAGLAAGLSKIGGISLFATYGPQETELASVLSGLLPEVPFLGDASFGEWSARLSLASVLVTMDTSASHVAAGVGLPSAVVFEEEFFRHTFERWRPWMTPCEGLCRRDLRGLSARAAAEESASFAGRVVSAAEKLLDSRRN